MVGRIENEQKIESSVEDRLKKMPYYVTDWYYNMRASRKTAATCRTYISKVYDLLAYIDKDVKGVELKDINQQNVTAYFTSVQTKTDSKGKTVQTSDSHQQGTWCALNSFFGYLEKSKQIDINYISIIEKPKNKDLERINANRILLTKEDFRAILKAVEMEKNPNKQRRDMAIILMFMTTGMRTTALASINLEDVDLENSTITVIDKGNKRHEYVINDSLRKALVRWKFQRRRYKNAKELDALFLSNKGNRISTDAIYTIVEKYCEIGLGKHVSPHKLRAGFCSILYNKTGDIEFVRRCVGHSMAATTQRYIVTDGKEGEKASIIMDDLL